MHFVTCMVRIGGDMRNVVPRGAFSPVSWPEIEVLRHIHGDEAIIDVVALAKVDQSAKAEKDRLSHIYGAGVIEDVFPGRNPSMEMEMPGVKSLDPNVVWKSPIDVDPSAHGTPEPKAAKAPAAEKAKPAAF